MSRTIMILLVLYSLTGCQKIKEPVVTYPFVIPAAVEPVELRIHDKDVDLYKAYIKALRLRSQELTRQIMEYKNITEE